MNPRIPEEKEQLAAICSLPGITWRQVRQLLTTYGSPSGSWTAVGKGCSLPDIKSYRVAQWRDFAGDLDPPAYLVSLEQAGINVIARGESGFPRLLEEIHQPPWVLFCRGVMPSECGRHFLSVVGSRKATPYGIEAARWFAGELAGAGLVIASGGAYGIDSAAHRSAMDAGGNTVVVLGCGPDVTYPRSNSALFRRATEKGCLLSEYPPGVEPLKHHFPARTRLIAGISLGVLVVEASQTSGSLITADFALSQGRDVFAVPGSIFSKTSAGANRLIRNGAVPVTDPGEVLEELQLRAAPVCSGRSREHELSEGEKNVLDSLRSAPDGAEGISSATKMRTGEVVSCLSQLEIKGLVRRGAGGTYHRADH